MSQSPFGPEMSGSRRRRRRVAKGVVVALVSLAMVAIGVTLPSQAASAAGTASVSISPATTTVPAGMSTTMTLSISCSVTGGCADTTLTFPVTSYTDLTGTTVNDSTRFGALSCSGWTRTTSATLVTYTYTGGTPAGTLATGTQQCTFIYGTKTYTTPNGQTFSIVPTINGSNFTSSTGDAATITTTAEHDVTFTKSATTDGTVGQGGQFVYDLHFNCTPNAVRGSIGTSSFTVVDKLPANFTYQSYVTWYNANNGNHGVGTFAGTITYDEASHTLTYSDPDGDICNGGIHTNGVGGTSPGRDIRITGTASTGGVPDEIGSTLTNTATATFTYLDGTTGSIPATTTTTVVSVVDDPFLDKNSTSQSLPNRGEYTYPPNNGATYPYVYPGDWNGSGISAQYPILLSTNGTQAGAAFAVQDPMPCTSNNATPGTAANPSYSSGAPGEVCTDPAFIPTLIPATGFAPTAADEVTVVDTDGDSTSIAYTPGTGWIIPTSPAVSEIDFPPFAEEGQNTGRMQFTVMGYAAADLAVNSLMTNTATVNAYLVGSDVPLVPQETSSASVLVVAADTPSGTVIQPGIWPQIKGGTTCTETVPIGGFGGNGPQSSYVEIADAPSAAIYFSYLAPEGATVTGGSSQTFTFTPVDFSSFSNTPGGVSATTSTIDAVVTADYNGTGRQLLQWVIPADTITSPGDYSFGATALTVDLGPGCAGVYQNDITVGYGAPITGCSDPGGIAVPSNGVNDALNTTNAPDATNYCGESLNITVAPINPGFSVDKSVQGNLDADPVTGGGVGNVSPDGGTAAYKVTFTNTGATNLVDPVMYDLLPAVGDTNTTSTTARGSEFGVALTGVGPVPDGVTVSYSQASNPCRAEVLAVNPGCTDDWSTTPPSSLASVTALRFSYAGTVYVSGGNGINSFSIPYTVSTPADIAGKTAWNTVGTTANPGVGQDALTAAESSRTGLKAQAGLQLVKVASPTTVDTVGQTVTYTFTVTNGSAVALNGITVHDDQTAPAGALTTGPTCPSATLAPGASEDCTATYVVTQKDLDKGSITDTATASGTPTSGSALVSAPATATVTATQTPAITMTKSASPTTVSRAGDTVTYSFVVVNTGNVTVHEVGIQEDIFTGSATPPTVSCPTTPLAPTKQMTCSATYSVSQANIDDGAVVNTAHATALDPNDAVVASDASSATVTATQSPALSLVKSATPPSAPVADQVVHYDFVVTNTGNVTMTDIGIQEGVFTGHDPLAAPTCPGTSLAPGAQLVCSTDYTATQDDVDSGSISNTATAFGTPTGSETPVVSDPSTVTVPEPINPVLTLKKTADVSTITRAGQPIAYTFTVTNDGNVTLFDAAIKEGTFTGTGNLSAPDCPAEASELLPGQVIVCTASYTVVDADLTGKALSNTATATATLTGGDPVESDPSTVRIAEVLPAGPTAPLAATGIQIGWGFGDLALLGIAAGALLLVLRRRRSA
jgi:uncharacterized repeat protein (TIGR01451 family)